MEDKIYCWICNNIADSAEHRIKKSDLISLHGSGSYQGENTLYLFRGKEEYKIQGANSKIVKYEKTLCSHCNNAFSQPFDKAYESFINYIKNNESLILKRRFIDFREVYGDDFETSQKNLFKYFVKSFGCRITDSGFLVPEDLSILLSENTFWTGLTITFSVDEDYQDFDFHILANGELIYFPKSKTDLSPEEKRMYGQEYPAQYHTSQNFKSLTIWFWYNLPPDGTLGSSWIANTQFIYLGSHERFSSERRQELKQKYCRSHNDGD